MFRTASILKIAGLMIATVATIATALIPAQAQDKLRLTLGTGIAPTVPTSWMFSDYIAPRLEKYSEGKITTNVQINGALCSEHKCVEQARLGQIDIGSVSGGNIGAFGTAVDILNLPYIFKDDKSAEKVLNGWLAVELGKRAAAEMKLRFLAIIPSYSFRQIDNNVREVRVPSDLKGIKIRVTKTPTELNLIKAWGAVPVPYDWAQLYEGLQTKVVNGMYIPDAYVAARKFYEVTPYITHVGGAWNSHIIFMDQKRYDRLPDWAKKIVDRVGAELQRDCWAIDAEWMGKRLKELEGKVKIYKPTEKEMELWYKGAPAAWKAVKGTYDPKLARRVLEEQGLTSLIKELESAGAL
jgi:TRAP-type C4-dicarboxylate transport system substrate-binding protein